MIISHNSYKEEVVIIDCVIVQGYSRMCNHAWKSDIGRWSLPQSVFTAYHEITGYNKKVREFLLRQRIENKD